MEQIENTATIIEVTEQLESYNLALLFSDLVNYALNMMKGHDIIQAEKIVGDVFEKTVSGVRKWNKKYSFKSFLFLAVKSLVSQYNDKFEKTMDVDYKYALEDFSDLTLNNSSDLEALKNKLSERLKKSIPPPDEIEQMVFECWMDEKKKPKEIAEFWGLDIKDVYKAVKRLERKLDPIRALLNSTRNE